LFGFPVSLVESRGQALPIASHVISCTALRFGIGLSSLVNSPYAERDKNSERSELHRKYQCVVIHVVSSPSGAAHSKGEPSLSAKI